jgi:hypothetical protein
MSSYPFRIIGGKGIDCKIMYDETDPEVNSFDPESVIVSGAGLLMVVKEVPFFFRSLQGVVERFFDNPFSMVDRPTMCSSLVIPSFKIASWMGPLPNLAQLYCFFQG